MTTEERVVEVETKLPALMPWKRELAMLHSQSLHQRFHVANIDSDSSRTWSLDPVVHSFRNEPIAYIHNG